MKWYHWLILVGVEFFLLIFFLVVPVIVLNHSWLWFIIPLIFLIVGDLITAVIILVLKLRKKDGMETKITPEEAEQIAKYKMVYDDDNPDNFIVSKRKILNIGERGTQMTPILILDGKGTETNDHRVAIINLNDARARISCLIDPTKEEVIETIIKMADYPPTEEIIERVSSGMNQFGQPIVTERVRKPTQQQAKAELEQKQADQKGAT